MDKVKSYLSSAIFARFPASIALGLSFVLLITPMDALWKSHKYNYWGIDKPNIYLDIDPVLSMMSTNGYCGPTGALWYILRKYTPEREQMPIIIFPPINPGTMGKADARIYGMLEPNPEGWSIEDAAAPNLSKEQVEALFSIIDYDMVRMPTKPSGIKGWIIKNRQMPQCIFCIPSNLLKLYAGNMASAPGIDARLKLYVRYAEYGKMKRYILLVPLNYLELLDEKS